MALARTDLLQASTGASGNFGTGNFTTGSLTPPSSSLLVAAVMFIENNGTTTDPDGAMTISGGSLGYTKRVSVTTAATNFPTWTGIYTAPVTTGASMTLTVGSGGRISGMYAVSIVAYTGYDTSTPTGATGTTQQNGGVSPAPNPVSLTLSAAPATTSEVFAAMGADKNTAGVTPGATFTEVHQPTLNVDWGELETEARTGSTSTTVDWVDIRSGGGALFNWTAVAVEINAAGAGGGPDFSYVGGMVIAG